MEVQPLGRDVTVLHDSAEVPGIGHLAVNSFVLHAKQPVVVDTGLGLPDRGFLDALGSVLDPRDVRWIWLTHPDRDHTGAIFELLDEAPDAKVVTTFLGVGIMSTATPLPMDRVHLLNPGQALDVGDRKLLAFRPPVFDSPATMGFVDGLRGTAITSDCFGAPLSSAELAGATDVADVGADELRAMQMLWASVDSPWVHATDAARFRAGFEPLRTMAPEVLLSTHLPPATGRLADFLDVLEATRDASPFVGPDQAALEAMLAEFEPAVPA